MLLFVILRKTKTLLPIDQFPVNYICIVAAVLSLVTNSGSIYSENLYLLEFTKHPNRQFTYIGYLRLFCVKIE